jgi:hypothetical protein
MAGGSMLLDCVFDETIDDYRKEYEIFWLPPIDNLMLVGSWLHLRGQYLESLGSVPVKRVNLDPTRRQRIDIEALLAFLREHGPPGQSQQRL